jgi:hypothetical protein
MPAPLTPPARQPGAVLQECCPYPEQVGVRVRILVPVQHSQVATLADQGHPARESSASPLAIASRAPSTSGAAALLGYTHTSSPAPPPTRMPEADYRPTRTRPRPPRRRRRPTFPRRPPSTNPARHQRGSPGLALNAAKVGLKFAHQPKEIHVEPRILGTRLRITRAYRSSALVCLRGSRGRLQVAGHGVWLLLLSSSVIGRRGSNIDRAVSTRERLAQSAAVPRRLTSLSSGNVPRTISATLRPTGGSSRTTRGRTRQRQGPRGALDGRRVEQRQPHLRHGLLVLYRRVPTAGGCRITSARLDSLRVAQRDR